MALSESWQLALAIAQIVTCIVVSLGLIVAIVTIIFNVSTAKKVHTSVFLAESRFDRDYKKGLSTLKSVHESGGRFRALIIPVAGTSLSDEDRANGKEIVYCLSFYERMAVSIRNKIFDETMVKEVFYSSVVNNYTRSEPLIKAIREKENKGTYFQEYQWLAERWKRKPLREKTR